MAFSLNAVRDVSSGLVKLTTLEGVDLAVAPAEPALFTVPAGKTAVMVFAVVRVATAATVVGTATVGIGKDVDEGDVFAPRALTGLTAVGDSFVIIGESKQVVGAESDVFKLGIDTAITSGTLTVDVDLFGFYVGEDAVNSPAYVSFTPTGTWTGGVTYTGRYLLTPTVSGYVMDLVVVVEVTGTVAPAATALQIDMPSGLAIDMARASTWTGNAAFDNTTSVYPGRTSPLAGGADVDVRHFDGSAPPVLLGVTDTAPFASGVGSKYFIEARLPVVAA